MRVLHTGFRFMTHLSNCYLDAGLLWPRQTTYKTKQMSEVH